VKAGRMLWAGLILLALASGEVAAQTSVDTRVQKLEETVRILEQRVASLENQLRAKSAPTGVASDKANWRKLQKGMSEGDVEKLLGSPSRVDVFGTFSVWHYDGPKGGQVQFDDRRTVQEWHER